jgi:hypothetical protein
MGEVGINDEGVVCVAVGPTVGEGVGKDGLAVDGRNVGIYEDDIVGLFDGFANGQKDGSAVGTRVGLFDEIIEGS